MCFLKCYFIVKKILFSFSISLISFSRVSLLSSTFPFIRFCPTRIHPSVSLTVFPE